MATATVVSAKMPPPRPRLDETARNLCAAAERTAEFTLATAPFSRHSRFPDPRSPDSTTKKTPAEQGFYGVGDRGLEPMTSAA